MHRTSHPTKRVDTTRNNMAEDERWRASGKESYLKEDLAREEPWRIPLWNRGKVYHRPSESDNLPILIFFPEIIVVAVCVLFSPMWCLRLMKHGNYVYGCLVLAIGLGGGISFVWFMVKRKRFIAFLIMIAIILACLLLNGSLPPAERFM